jgi:hypothetical protein
VTHPADARHVAFSQTLGAELALLDQFRVLTRQFQELLGSEVKLRHINARTAAATTARLQSLAEQAQRLQAQMQAIHLAYHAAYPQEPGPA